jgi:hypothetical protein
VSEDVFSAHAVDENRLTNGLPDVTPLPWLQCAGLIFLGSATCYGLGFLVLLGFIHLLGLVQP